MPARLLAISFVLYAGWVDAAPIRFTFEGTDTAFLENTFFSAPPFTITAIANTSNIVTSPNGDGARGGDFSLDTTNSRIAIEGIGEYSVLYIAGDAFFTGGTVEFNFLDGFDSAQEIYLALSARKYDSGLGYLEL